MELAYLNGVFGPIGEAKVSIEDRGFQFGDGVYEVVMAYDGRLFLLEQHLQRFRRSAATIKLAYDFEDQPLEPIVEEGLRRSGLGDAMVYLQLTRGVAPRSHACPTGLDPTVVMTFKALPLLPDDLRRDGAKMITTPETRWSQCFIKAITLLPNALAKTEAMDRGCYDAIFVTQDGEVRECTAANIFIVIDGTILTPPRTHSILHGVTQGFLMDCAASLDWKIEERRIELRQLLEADEVFSSSSLIEVLGITMVDGQPIGDGKVGPRTSKLFEAFRERSRSQGGPPSVKAHHRPR